MHIVFVISAMRKYNMKSLSYGPFISVELLSIHTDQSDDGTTYLIILSLHYLLPYYTKMFQIFDLIWDAEVVSRNYDKTSELNVTKILAFDSTFILVKFISEGVQSVESWWELNLMYMSWSIQ